MAVDAIKLISSHEEILTAREALDTRDRKLNYDTLTLTQRVVKSFQAFLATKDGVMKVTTLAGASITLLKIQGYALPNWTVPVSKVFTDAKDVCQLTFPFAEKTDKLLSPELKTKYAIKVADFAKAVATVALWSISMGIVHSIPLLGSKDILILGFKSLSNFSGSVSSGLEIYNEAPESRNQLSTLKVMTIAKAVAFLALAVLTLAVVTHYVEATAAIILIQNLLNFSGTLLAIVAYLYKEAVVGPQSRV